MRIAYLDCFSGISGDMFLGALVDAGVPAKLFEDTVAALNIGARLEISRVNRSGIAATKVDVFVHGEKGVAARGFLGAAESAQEHEHEHATDTSMVTNMLIMSSRRIAGTQLRPGADRRLAGGGARATSQLT